MVKRTSKKEQAINDLTGYIGVLSQINDRDAGATWKTNVREILIRALGRESSFVTTLDNTYFTKKLEHSRWEFDPKKREAFRVLLYGAIEHIEAYGLYESHNWLHKFSNVKLICAAIPIVGSIWWFGQWCGERWEKTEKSEEFSKLYNDHKMLERDHRDLKVFYDRLKANEDSFKVSVNKGIRIRDREIDSLKIEIKNNKVKQLNSPNSNVQIGTNNTNK